MGQTFLSYVLFPKKSGQFFVKFLAKGYFYFELTFLNVSSIATGRQQASWLQPLSCKSYADGFDNMDRQVDDFLGQDEIVETIKGGTTHVL